MASAADARFRRRPKSASSSESTLRRRQVTNAWRRCVISRSQILCVENDAMMTRRDFTAKAAAAVTVATSAKSYSQILGANNRLNFAVIGLSSRAYAHRSALKDNKAHARISHVCDVESNILAKFAAATEKSMGEAPAKERDFRNLLARRDVDAITIA